MYSFPQMWPHLLKNALMENFIFCAVWEWNMSHIALSFANQKVDSDKLVISVNDCMLLSCHVPVQSQSTRYSCLNVKEILASSRWDISSLSESNRIRTHNHLVRKRTFNHLAKLANDSTVLCVVIYTVHLTGCYYHVKYVF